jgi:hypothetical protein
LSQTSTEWNGIAFGFTSGNILLSNVASKKWGCHLGVVDHRSKASEEEITMRHNFVSGMHKDARRKTFQLMNRPQNSEN